jgi:formylglycine-generating enzyme required for sulfatase activity/serine/threonine protein kinase
VAVKIFPSERLEDHKAVARFEQEMKAVGRLDHSNIVQAMDAGEIDGNHFLAMEYVDGRNLIELVDHFGPLSVPDACELARQAALGLSEAHTRGMVHRDVKPSNLMLARPARKGDLPVVKILDLGLARLSDVHAPGGDENVSVATTQMMGTLDYMAPEQGSDSHQVDARADIYSLGATLYKLLAGLAPFEDGQHGSIVSKLMALAAQVPAPLHELRSDVPLELGRIVARMLAKSPAERFSTAAEVASALAPFCNGGNLSALLVDQSVGTSPERSRISVTLHGRHSLTVPTPRGPARWRSSPTVWLGAMALVLTAGAFAWSRLAGNRQLDDGTKPLAVKAQSPKPQEEKENRDDDGKEGSLPAAEAGGGQNWPAGAPRPAIAPFDADQAQRHQSEWADYLNVPVEHTNSVGMTFRLVPPGEYRRGASAEEIASVEVGVVNSPQWIILIRSSGPRHKVILTRPFYLGVHEVTQEEYERVMGTNPSAHSPQGARRDRVEGLDTRSFPVESVSWNDAVDYCIKLSLAEGLTPCYERIGERVNWLEGSGYRLPTEAEWEFACRAGTEMRYSSGETLADLRRVGWSMENSGKRSHRVGELAANPFQFYDMHGNVAEWCQDRWSATYYGESAEKPAVDPLGPLPTGNPHPIRGGLFDNYATNLRSAFRDTFGPPYVNPGVGLRVVLPIGTVANAAKSAGE